MRVCALIGTGVVEHARKIDGDLIDFVGSDKTSSRAVSLAYKCMYVYIFECVCVSEMKI